MLKVFHALRIQKALNLNTDISKCLSLIARCMNLSACELAKHSTLVRTTRWYTTPTQIPSCPLDPSGQVENYFKLWITGWQLEQRWQKLIPGCGQNAAYAKSSRYAVIAASTLWMWCWVSIAFSMVTQACLQMYTATWSSHICTNAPRM